MAIWLKDLTGTERRTLWACLGGWSLDGFDATVFSYAMPALIALHFLTKPEAGILGTVTLVTSAFGGWLTGILCDRFGRVRMLQATIAWFAGFTLLCGLSQNYTQFLIFRSLEGLGFGGEWTAGALLMAETIRAQYRGRAVGTVQAGYGIGVAIAGIAYAVLLSRFSASLGWRSLFFVGFLPALFVLFIRRNVRPDAPVARTPADAAGGRVFGFLSRGYLRRTVIATVTVTGAQGAFYGMATWLPLFLRSDRDLSVLGTASYSIVVAIGSITGFLVGAHLADYIGRRRTMVLFGASNAVIIVLYMAAPLSDVSLLPLGFLLGFTTSARFSPIGPLLSELYPTWCRASAQGFIYNLGRGIGAFAPALIGFAAGSWGLGPAIAVYVIVGNALQVGGVLLLPETRGQELRA